MGLLVWSCTCSSPSPACFPADDGDGALREEVGGVRGKGVGMAEEGTLFTGDLYLPAVDKGAGYGKALPFCFPETRCDGERWEAFSFSTVPSSGTVEVVPVGPALACVGGVVLVLPEESALARRARGAVRTFTNGPWWSRCFNSSVCWRNVSWTSCCCLSWINCCCCSNCSFWRLCWSNRDGTVHNRCPLPSTPPTPPSWPDRRLADTVKCGLFPRGEELLMGMRVVLAVGLELDVIGGVVWCASGGWCQ